MLANGKRCELIFPSADTSDSGWIGPTWKKRVVELEVVFK